jgi:hypothetical protein
LPSYEIRYRSSPNSPTAAASEHNRLRLFFLPYFLPFRQLVLALSRAGNVFCALPQKRQTKVFPGQRQTISLIKPMPSELQLPFGT